MNAPCHVLDTTEEDIMDRPDVTTERNPGSPRDRRRVDGEAGRGDMLGGLNAGAGDRLGVPEPDEEERFAAETSPMSGYQHDLDDADPATDAAQNYHGPDDPA
jgi:hypothetical protein